MNHGFMLPPENQGQIVEIAYALVEGLVIRRRYDRSDGETRYHASKCLVEDEGDYWNHAPANKRWRRIEEQDALRLVEEED